MIIDLREVFSQVGKSVGVEFAVDMSDFEYNGCVAVSEPVKAVGRVYNRAGVVMLEYSADYTFSAPCDRCADTVTRLVHKSFSHTVVTELCDEEYEELDYLVAPNMSLDLSEVARDDLLLNMPTKFLCKEDCKGICPNCGKSLNSEECVCERECDPRLAKLKELLD